MVDSRYSGGLCSFLEKSMRTNSKGTFFQARRRLQGEPRRQSTKAIHRALEPFWIRMNSREETGTKRGWIGQPTTGPDVLTMTQIDSSRVKLCSIQSKTVV